MQSVYFAVPVDWARFSRKRIKEIKKKGNKFLKKIIKKKFLNEMKEKIKRRKNKRKSKSEKKKDDFA